MHTHTQCHVVLLYLSISFEMLEDVTDTKEELSLTSAPERDFQLSFHLYPLCNTS